MSIKSSSGSIKSSEGVAFSPVISRIHQGSKVRREQLFRSRVDTEMTQVAHTDRVIKM